MMWDDFRDIDVKICQRRQWQEQVNRNQVTILMHRVLHLRRHFTKPEQIFLQNLLFLRHQIFHIPHRPNEPTAQEIWLRTRHSSAKMTWKLN